MKTAKIKKYVTMVFAGLAAVFIFSCGGGGDNEWSAGANCGNGVCDKGEDIILLTDPVKFTCGKDCPGTCGDGLCNPEHETKDDCPQDCPE